MTRLTVRRFEAGQAPDQVAAQRHGRPAAQVVLGESVGQMNPLMMKNSSTPNQPACMTYDRTASGPPRRANRGFAGKNTLCVWNATTAKMAMKQPVNLGDEPARHVTRESAPRDGGRQPLASDAFRLRQFQLSRVR
jgi:hypothetical protein